MAVSAGCDTDVDEAGGNESQATVCTTVGSTWWNQSFTDQTGRFHVELDATPSAGKIDGTIGLSAGAATKWTSLAAIIRFNPQGTIDARSGSDYKADYTLQYVAGTTYHLRFDVDLATRTYSAWVRYPGNVDYTPIGRNYPFRTEQAGVTHLNNISVFVNPQTGAGALTICGWSAIADGTTADGCTINTANAGFMNRAIPAATTVQRVSLLARPQANNIDAVVGVSAGNATSYNDLAASIRFYTNGLVEARDGDTYRADNTVTYKAGDEFDVRFVIDLSSKTYSVYIEGTDSERYLNRVVLAKNYKFRPQQASVASLANIATVVASASGRVDTCSVLGGPHPKLASARGGTWQAKALAGGAALLSDGSSTIRVGSNNVPTASINVGGKIAADSAGNVYIASIANGIVTLRAYTPTFGSRWTATQTTGDTAVGDVVVTGRGHVAIAVGTQDNQGFHPRRVVRFDSYGRYLSTTNMFAGATAIGMSTNHYAVVLPISGGNEVEIWGYETNELVRTRQFVGPFSITKIAIAPDDNVVIGGQLNTSTNQTTYFDDCGISPYTDGGGEVYWDTYIASLRSDLFTQFCKRLTNDVAGLAADGTQVAVSYLTWTQLHYVTIAVFDRSGNGIKGSDEDNFVGTSGFGWPGDIALGTAGQIYLDESATFGGPADGSVPVLTTLSL